MCGIHTLHIHSRVDQSERDWAIRRFNSHETHYTTLLTSTQLSAFGVDFHFACHTGIMLEEPINTGTAVQAMGRLWRLGQTQDVRFYKVICQDTYDSVMEARNLEKYAVALTAENDIDSRITGQHRLICAYEMIRQIFGQSHNRYPLLRVYWDKIDSTEVITECHFYSALANFFSKYPELSCKVDDASITDVAKRWRYGQVLSPDDVLLNSLELESGGTTIHNFMVNEQDIKPIGNAKLNSGGIKTFLSSKQDEEEESSEIEWSDEESVVTREDDVPLSDTESPQETDDSDNERPKKRARTANIGELSAGKRSGGGAQSYVRNVPVGERTRLQHRATKI